MLKANKHVCSVCTDFLAEGVKEDDLKETVKKMKEDKFEEKEKIALEISDVLTDLTFEDFYKENKERFKEVSKKEVADEMFFIGIMGGLGLVKMSEMPMDYFEFLLDLSKMISGDVESMENFVKKMSKEEVSKKILDKLKDRIKQIKEIRKDDKV